MNLIISILSIALLPVLTGGAWLGDKVGTTIIAEEQKISTKVEAAKSKVKTYLILGVVGYVAYKFYTRRR